MSSESVPVFPEDPASEASTHSAPQPHSDKLNISDEGSIETLPSQRSRTRQVWVFVLLRLLFFAVPLGIMLVLQFDPWYAAITSALIGFALSLLLLQRQRDPLLEMVYQRGAGNQSKSVQGQDEDFEDAAVDSMQIQDAEPASENNASSEN